MDSTKKDINQNEQEAEKAVLQEKEINNLIMTEDNIEMTHHMANCEKCKTDPAAVASLLGCNLYDEHSDEVTTTEQEDVKCQTM